MAPRRPGTGPTPPAFNPGDFQIFTGLQVPDPITFVLAPQWLNQRSLFPRQATLLKIIFLREDLFTDYDYAVVEEWEASFQRTGNNGITPNVLERMRYLKSEGYLWFREVLLVMGRRAGKGHISALAMTYILWNYMAKGDPQKHYGIAPNKQLECLIYAGKKEQARRNVFKDVVDTISNAPCFSDYVSRSLVDSLTIFAPADKLKMAERARRGLDIGFDQASFSFQPREATLMSGRGGASFMQAYDEMAHVVATGANRSAEEIYGTSTPALDQFKKDAFIIEPSSPWQQTGQFYTNYEHALEIDDETHKPVYPEMLMVQLASWDIYKDWEKSNELSAFPDSFAGDLEEYMHAPLPKYPVLQGAFQEYDDRMRNLERSNPDTFKVERRSHWAATMDAYLNEEKIAQMWDDTLVKHTRGKLNLFYKGHIDPSSSNANFGIAIAHTEPDPNGTGFDICVFDYISHWKPSDFPDGHIDYIKVVDQIWELIAGFPIDEFTYDQFSSGPIRSMLQQKAMSFSGFKQPHIFEVTATAPVNWRKAENFKTALNQGWVKAPYDEQADLELRFLRLVETATTMRVDKQETGPVTTKDVADCLFECVNALLGDQIEAMKKGLTHNPIAGGLQGGITPFGGITHEDEKLFTQFGGGRVMNPGAGRYVGNGFGGSVDPARGVRRDGAGRPR